MSKLIHLGITLGDINGIGPEIALKAALQHRWPRQVRLILIGSREVLADEARRCRLPVPPPSLPGEQLPPVCCWDPAPGLKPARRPGQIRAESARAALAWIRAATEACLDTRLDGMITGPICKEAFHKAGIPFPGHTELLAELTDTKTYAMMLFGGPLRVVLATRHLPLSKVPAALNRKELLETIYLAGEALPWLGCPRARIGVCGLNPHAGDGGVLGGEEKRIITPAIQRARHDGVNVEGPIPADAIFRQAAEGRYDAIIAMYHDQGLAPLKMIAFDTGVNVTLGLPIVRTSPDHGTAFDIAGKNRANPSSLCAAITCAQQLALRPNPWT